MRQDCTQEDNAPVSSTHNPPLGRAAQGRARSARVAPARQRATPSPLGCPGSTLEEVEVGVERRHHLARVRPDANVGQSRHRAGHLGLGQEAHQANHRKAPVVDLCEQPLGFLLGGGVLAEAEGVEEVEGDRVGQLGKRGEVAGLAAAHVVLLALLAQDVRVLAPELKEGDGQDDLPFRRLRRYVPQLLRGEPLWRRHRNLVPREANVVGMHDVAHKAGHRDATVLDLRLAQEADRR
mmetsp:Transcript_42930/g.142924  ORF Transcript_42930/g.142924 Transcript_42930/m.142924 type:complete len:237 (-) Transcript_42930:231-941(-)